MAGVNLALKEHTNLFESAKEKSFSSTSDKPCIFISYQRSDEKFAKEVADYILNDEYSNLDVYFDLNDNKLNYAQKNGIFKGINQCILNGLTVSQYMIVVLSNSTMVSYWVPFEIGVGYGQVKEIIILNHKNVGTSLPSYIKTLENISSKRELDNYLKSKSSKLRKFTELYSPLKQSINPLRDYLND